MTQKTEMKRDTYMSERVAPSTYGAELVDGYQVTMRVSAAGVVVTWSPRTPKLSAEQVETYRQWRNDCLRDYAAKSGLKIVVVEG